MSAQQSMTVEKFCSWQEQHDRELAKRHAELRASLEDAVLRQLQHRRRTGFDLQAAGEWVLGALGTGQPRAVRADIVAILRAVGVEVAE